MQRTRARTFGRSTTCSRCASSSTTVGDCYNALGVVHALWQPIPGQFDDYIASPKESLYQSLHTTVMALGGQPARDPDPHARDAPARRVRRRRALALQGGRASADRAYDAEASPGCASSSSGSATSERRDEFVESRQDDLFQDQVFVFTPKGEIKDLPAGATPIDFAYRIHTDVGHRCVGAKVNGRLVPLDYQLQNGDVVEIVRTQERARAVARLAQPEPRLRRPATRARRSASGSRARTAPRTSSAGASRWSGSCGGWPASRSSRSARNGSPKSPRPTTSRPWTISTRRWATGPSAPPRSSCASGSWTTPKWACRRSPRRWLPRSAGGIRVKGVGDLLVRFAKCCHPIPGDPVVGFITRGKGVTVHLQTCPTVVYTAETSRPHRRRMGSRRGQDLPDRHPRRSLRSNGTPERRHAGRGRREGQHPVRGRRGCAGSDRHDPGDAPGLLGLAARTGHGPHRTAAGRHHGAARPGVGNLRPRWGTRRQRNRSHATGRSPDVRAAPAWQFRSGWCRWRRGRRGRPPRQHPAGGPGVG